MATEKVQSRLSPSIKIHPPTKRQGAEEKTQEGDMILRRLQHGSTTSLGRLPEPRRQSCIALGLNRENAETRTIRGRVKSTESLNSKSLLAADILKNCRKAQVRSDFESRKLHHASRCQTADVYCRPVNNPVGTRLQNRSKSAAPRTSLNSANCNNLDSRGMENIKLNQAKTLQVENNRLLLRRTSLPSESFRGKRIIADSILEKYDKKNANSYEPANKNKFKAKVEAVKTTLPVIHRIGSAGSSLVQLGKEEKTQEYSKEKKAKSTLDVSVACRRDSLVIPSRPSSSISCGSDGVDEEICHSTATKSLDLSDTSDSESEPPQSPGTPRRKQSSTARKKANRKGKSPRSAEDDSDSKSSDSDASSVNTDEESDKHVQPTRSDYSPKHGKKSSLQATSRHNNDNINNNDNVDESDSDCVDESDPLASTLNQMSIPGMPALDMLELQEKQLTQKPTYPGKGVSKARQKQTSIDNEDELADDVEDLIDTIDELIEADDADIAYEASIENKQARKKKSFKNTTRLIMAARKINKT